MASKEQLEKAHLDRSNFIQKLVQSSSDASAEFRIGEEGVPRVIVQFWDDSNSIPPDVKECMDSWKSLDEAGFERKVFGRDEALKYILDNLGEKYAQAFMNCYHPAMQSDYFRLCYIYSSGGCYIDVDDVYIGDNFSQYFLDNKLKIQPLCYDMVQNSMVNVTSFTSPSINDEDRIFYFNNNPLISSKSHPLVRKALEKSTKKLTNLSPSSFPEIQETTGPGNLSDTIFAELASDSNLRKMLYVLKEWNDIARTEWNLSYRLDNRNWRLANGKEFSNENL